MQKPARTYRGKCKCGSVEFEIELDSIELATCNCAICEGKKMLVVEVNETNFRLLRGVQALSFTQLKSRASKHYFCTKCEMHPFQRSRETPDTISVNTACLRDAGSEMAAAGCATDVKSI